MNMICIIVGVVTFVSFIRPKALQLQSLPLKAWRISGEPWSFFILFGLAIEYASRICYDIYRLYFRWKRLSDVGFAHTRHKQPDYGSVGRRWQGNISNNNRRAKASGTWQSYSSSALPSSVPEDQRPQDKPGRKTDMSLGTRNGSLDQKKVYGIPVSPQTAPKDRSRAIHGREVNRETLRNMEDQYYSSSPQHSCICFHLIHTSRPI